MRVAHLPQRHGIDQIDVAGDARGERLFRVAPGVFPQQGQVVVRHFTLSFTPAAKANRLFCPWQPENFAWQAGDILF
jgi:hypothetical protein